MFLKNCQYVVFGIEARKLQYLISHLSTVYQSLKNTKTDMKILADTNIAHLEDFFIADGWGEPVELIKMAGREITQIQINQHQPDILLVRSVTQVNETLLKDNHSVRFVGSATIGVDHIDEAYLKQKNIGFANAAGCSRHSVAQYVLTSLFQLQPDYLFAPITLGIVGLGNIGSTLATYAQAFGWQVLGYDPFLPKSPLNHHNFDELLQCSDVISLHIPLTYDGKHPTHHLFDESVFAKLLSVKSKVKVLINSARGSVIAENSIRMLSLNPQHTPKVVLDVFEHEPIVGKGVFDAVNIATPHIAGYTLEGKIRGTQMVYEAICHYFNKPIRVDFKDFLPTEKVLFTDNSFYQANQFNLAQKEHLLLSLPTMYDILQDDTRLREQLTLQPSSIIEGTTEGLPEPCVLPNDFDSLRKHYPLRREWQAYEFCLPHNLTHGSDKQ